MKNLQIFCLTLNPLHKNIIDKLGYTSVGLGNNFFSKEWLSDKTGKNIAEKNPQNVNGWLPLHYAAYNGHTAICEFIHESGSSLNPKTNRGWTPLHFAVCNGHFQVCKLIVKVIDGKTLTNTKGLTQAEMAAKGYEKVQQLMENNNP